MGYVLTAMERRLLAEIPKHKTVLEAAKDLGLSESQAYATLFRVRRRIQRASEFMKDMNSLRRREPTLTRLLTPGEVRK